MQQIVYIYIYILYSSEYEYGTFVKICSINEKDYLSPHVYINTKKNIKYKKQMSEQQYQMLHISSILGI